MKHSLLGIAAFAFMFHSVGWFNEAAYKANIDHIDLQLVRCIRDVTRCKAKSTIWKI